MNDPLDALAAAHRAIADQARAAGDHGRASIHQWAAEQALIFKEQNR